MSQFSIFLLAVNFTVTKLHCFMKSITITIIRCNVLPQIPFLKRHIKSTPMNTPINLALQYNNYTGKVLHNLFEAIINLFRYPTNGRRARGKSII